MEDIARVFHTSTNPVFKAALVGGEVDEKLVECEKKYVRLMEYFASFTTDIETKNLERIQPDAKVYQVKKRIAEYEVFVYSFDKNFQNPQRPNED